MEDLKAAAQAYLQARKAFLTIANQHPALSGNDNLVGRIGEFIAYQYLEEQKRNPTRTDNTVEKGFDLLCDGEQQTMVSVKTITAENKAGRTTKIGEPWDELILIILNEAQKVEALGILTQAQLDQARKAGIVTNPTLYASRTMLGKNGLITRYGTKLSSNEVQRYL